MKLSIIVPVYNEEKSVLKILKDISKTNFKLDKEVIVINDGSKDNSEKIVSRFVKRKKGLYLIDKDHEGKGSALILGIKIARGDIIAIQDADLEYNIKDLKILVKAILNGEEVVYGSRFLRSKQKLSLFYFGNILLSFITSILYFQKIKDMETCYKVFRKNVIKSLDLKSKKFDIEPEITAKILKKGIRIKEIPVSYTPRFWNEGKKIKFRDGFAALWCLLKYRFVD